MTKVEHTKRTAEYVALLEQTGSKTPRKVADDTASLPPVARPAVLAPTMEAEAEYKEAPAAPKAKRKRNRKKGSKAVDAVYESEATGADLAADMQDEDEPSSKRRG